jgi:hypothetical protein
VLANSSIDQWNAIRMGLPYFVRYLAIISVIYYREKVQYFCNKNVITLVRTNKGQHVDWAQIIFNSLCSELDRWYEYIKENKGEEKYLSICLGIGKNLLVSICASKGQSKETTGQGLNN